jgi:translation elongation factor P/translation initiation factor 5A
LKLIDKNLYNMGDDDENLLTPCEAHDLKVGTYAMFFPHPVKILKVNVSKTGKHGHAKCNMDGKCVFSGKKVNEMQPGHQHMQMFTPKKSEFDVNDLNCDEDSDEYGDITLMDERGEQREDLNIFTCGAKSLEAPEEQKKAMKDFVDAWIANEEVDGPKTFSVTVLKAPFGAKGKTENQEMITEWSEVKE